MNISTCQNFVHPVREPSLLLGLGVQTLLHHMDKAKEAQKRGQQRSPESSAFQRNCASTNKKEETPLQEWQWEL
jgi:hypothetical protein